MTVEGRGRRTVSHDAYAARLLGNRTMTRGAATTALHASSDTRLDPHEVAHSHLVKAQLRRAVLSPFVFGSFRGANLLY